MRLRNILPVVIILVVISASMPQPIAAQSNLWSPPDDRFPSSGVFERYYYYRQWWWFFGWHYTDYYYGRTQCNLMATYVGTDGQNNDYYAVRVTYTVTPSMALPEPYYDPGNIISGWFQLTLGDNNYLQSYEPKASSEVAKFGISADFSKFTFTIQYGIPAITITTSSSGAEAGYVKWSYSVGQQSRNTEHVFEFTILVYTTNDASLYVGPCQSYTYWELIYPQALQGFTWTPFNYYTYHH